MYNYAIVIDTSDYTKKFDLDHSKSEVNKLDIDKLNKLDADKLKPVPVDLKGLSDVINK